jgi:hypothetical protein
MIYTRNYQIPDNSIELLQRLQKEGLAEFKSGAMNADLYAVESKDRFESVEAAKEYYFQRNFCNLEDMIPLAEAGLVQMEEDAWHESYRLSEDGKEFLENNSK